MTDATQSPALFGEWLRRTRELQRRSYGTDPAALAGADRARYFTEMSFALEDELHEVADEISWKPWAKAEFFNRDQYVNELVDLLHFAGNLLVLAGCSDDELNRRYSSKMEKNERRMESGYTGLDKCASCRRALDDVPLAKDSNVCVLCAAAGGEGRAVKI